MPPPCELWDLAVRAEWDPLLDPPPPPPSEYEIWVLWVCADGGYGSYMFTIFITDPPSAEAIRDEVFARIKPPNPLAVTSPDFEDVIVKTQTWLWLDGYVWASLEDSDSAGGISVTVRATPRYARWAMGEGSDVLCSGPGVPWTVGAGDVDTYCSYTYFDSSAITASGVFEAAVSVLWEFEWWEDGVYRGVFTTVEPSSSFAVDVDELQAIETGD